MKNHCYRVTYTLPFNLEKEISVKVLAWTATQAKGKVLKMLKEVGLEAHSIGAEYLR